MAKSIIGILKHRQRLRRLTGPKAERLLGEVAYSGADKVRVEARRLIADGAIQGKGHVASAPGEAPNWDTGELANKIVTRKSGRMSAQTAAYADHAAPLELGTSKMAARPFMSPAAKNTRKAVHDEATAVVTKLMMK